MFNTLSEMLVFAIKEIYDLMPRKSPASRWLMKVIENKSQGILNK
jgi:hypothetical protein